MANYNNIPQELKALAQWVCFVLEERGSQNGSTHQTKVLKTPNVFSRGGYPVNAKADDPQTWRSFDEALAALQKNKNKYDGIGFVLKHGGGYVFIDLDKCVDENGISKNAQQIIEKFGDTYVEKSVSGKGFHIVCRGDIARYLPEGRTGSKTGKTVIDGIKEIESYHERRFLTFTGDIVGSVNEIADCQTAIDWLYNTYPALNKAAGRKAVAVVRDLFAPKDDNKLIQVIENSKHANLWNGSAIGSYNNDESAIDQALMNVLAFYCGGDPEQMKRLFSRSALGQREKWTSRTDYQESTTKAALDSWDGTRYDPEEYFKKKKQEEINCFLEEQNKDNDEIVLHELFNRPCTDAGNMERLAGFCGDEWLFNGENERTQCWLHWNGKRWKAGNGSELSLLSIKVVRALQAYGEIKEKEVEAARQDATTNEEIEKADKQLKYLKQVNYYLFKSEDHSKLNNMKKLFADRQAVTSDKFDRNGWLLNVENGTLDLKTGVLLPHRREDYISKICRAAYITTPAPENLWEKTVAEILPNPEIRQWVQRLFGYCLVGEVREHIFVIFYGDGGTGKGTICESIASVLGDYAATINVDVLLTGRDENGNAPTSEIAKLVGKRLVLASESNRSRRFNEAKIKNLSGGDTLAARAVYGQPFQYTPQFKVILQTNYLPTIADSTDGGMKRRLYIVPFDAAFKRDPTLRSKLKSPAEQENILRWAFKGCVLYQQQGIETAPAQVEALKDKYFRDNDVFELWVESCCTKDPQGKLKTMTALESYNNFASAGNYRAQVGIKTFNDMLRRHGYEVRRDAETTKIFGICLNW